LPQSILKTVLDPTTSCVYECPQQERLVRGLAHDPIRLQVTIYCHLDGLYLVVGVHFLDPVKRRIRHWSFIERNLCIAVQTMLVLYFAKEIYPQLPGIIAARLKHPGAANQRFLESVIAPKILEQIRKITPPESDRVLRFANTLERGTTVFDPTNHGLTELPERSNAELKIMARAAASGKTTAEILRILREGDVDLRTTEEKHFPTVDWRAFD